MMILRTVISFETKLKLWKLGCEFQKLDIFPNVSQIYYKSCFKITAAAATVLAASGRKIIFCPNVTWSIESENQEEEMHRK